MKDKEIYQKALSDSEAQALASRVYPILDLIQRKVKLSFHNLTRASLTCAIKKLSPKDASMLANSLDLLGIKYTRIKDIKDDFLLDMARMFNPIVTNVRVALLRIFKKILSGFTGSCSFKQIIFSIKFTVLHQVSQHNALMKFLGVSNIYSLYTNRVLISFRC